MPVSTERSDAATLRVATVRTATVRIATEQPFAPTPALAAMEIGGPSGPEPTRYGDWERAGRCIDF
jgi:hypothetical protein